MTRVPESLADHWWFAQRHPDGEHFCVRHTARGPGSYTVDSAGVSTALLGKSGLTRKDAEAIAQALNEAYQLGKDKGGRDIW